MNSSYNPNAIGSIVPVFGAGSSSTPGANATGTATLAFTTAPTDKPVWSKTFTVVDARVTPTSLVVVAQSGATAAGRVGDDLAWDQILLGAVPGNGFFTVTALVHPGPIVGSRVIIYQIF